MRANLHLHLTGSMRPATLAELAERERLPLPDPLAPNVIHPWEAFQQRYDLARSVLRTHEDVARVAAEAVQDDARCGAAWTEIQIDPTSGLAARYAGQGVTGFGLSFDELCPTSYPPLGAAGSLGEAPLRAFMSAGVPVALGTDDPLLFGGSLDDQYAIARDHLGCTEEELTLLASQSMSASAANRLSREQTSANVQTG